MRRTQRGASGLFVAVLLILIAAGAIAILALSRSNSQIDRNKLAVFRISIVEAALHTYVTANGRLPCPANPTAATGDELPLVPTGICDFPQGTVPWKTLGVRPDDALDAWAQKISYRVFSGPTGLTQPDGASMVNCITVPIANAPEANGLCRATRDTGESNFLQGKGLTITNFVLPAITDAAYVLVSHGVSGSGAYTAEGVQRTPLPTADHESKNLLANGPFFAEAASDADATHFDDLLAFARIEDVIRKAGRGGRNWGTGSAGLSNVLLNSANVADALGSTPTPGDLGRNSLTFAGAGATVTSTGPSSPNLSFGDAGGTGGLGVGGDGVSYTNSEGFHLVFVQHAAKFALTLNDFGTGTDSGVPFMEQVRLDFFDSTVSTAIPAGSVTLGGCHPDGGLASFSVDTVSRFSSQFDIVDIVAIPPAGSPTAPSAFFMSEFKTCNIADAFCMTSLATIHNFCL